MTIYTSGGDEGFTTRPGGRRVPKSDAMLEAVGSVDELSSHLGLCLSACDDACAEIRDVLAQTQQELMVVGALLAAAGTGAAPKVTLDETSVRRMEQQMDRAVKQWGDLAHFILPRGCELAARLHVARTVCRRAERAAVKAVDSESRIPRIVLHYLNRLSDLLFTLARQANRANGCDEAPWHGAP
ncbi:MAG TPA: cob(I)yrinic acid a,c-diamide adenosyltransferase [Phycisphaerales bacterium]|nr:cob(I)yrinic acid a,c-diamide adenosyltransferase [Phycisphaerales bacterium]